MTNNQILTSATVKDKGIKLLKLCIDIFAHCAMDWEITLKGNGTSACEAANVAYEILDILGIDYKHVEPSVVEAVDKLKEIYGYE